VPDKPTRGAFAEEDIIIRQQFAFPIFVPVDHRRPHGVPSIWHALELEGEAEMRLVPLRVARRVRVVSLESLVTQPDESAVKHDVVELGRAGRVEHAVK